MMLDNFFTGYIGTIVSITAAFGLVIFPINILMGEDVTANSVLFGMSIFILYLSFGAYNRKKEREMESYLKKRD